MTEAIFGFIDKQIEVDGQLRPYAYKGRVSFLDAKYLGGEGSPTFQINRFLRERLLLRNHPLIRPILNNHQKSRKKNTKHEQVAQLWKYSDEEAKLRGQKYYWHQVKEENDQVLTLGKEEIKYKDFPKN